jgi:glycosyltransferase involved in cell wall biosynthesis
VSGGRTPDKARPLVSIVVPVFNGELFLRETLESVRRQTYRPIEIVVVDDGSTDGSAAIASLYPEIRWIWQPNSGVGAARNAGVGASEGAFVAFIDQDDLWLPHKIERQMDMLLGDGSVDYALTLQARFLQPGMAAPAWVRPGTIGVPLRAFDPSVLLVRRTSFLRVGRFDASYATGPDSDWFFRAKDAGLKAAWVDEVLVSRRVHASNASADPSGAAELRRIAHASIVRQRRLRERQS